ncbi:hypothetical protein GGR57DRAFT_454195 [Xylariaceae sp. FL1272]|nr:hypothetical protein GGR57DRAFT_454195 [Xylariaceae sp. FL1272]
MASRYPGSRYDGDSRRSRSRDRSPDRRSLYSDGGPRRSSNEFRANNTAFQANRDSFRDTLPRDTPRGPKALLDPPSGPRGGFQGEFRGRGRGGGRGRGWRDDSRDRGRDRDMDFRDRRDNSYRDERSRERDRPDWRDRDRDRDSFRGRRASPRGRSPPGRDFRDARDIRDGPLGVDADRARRGSRDGPLSAGSSSSDPPFAHPSYRGDSSYRGGYGRGRGRGRGGDWDRGRGRPFYEDRDRYGGPFRSRSQEGRFRDRDDRERDSRYMDPDVRPRDPRDSRDDRDARDREARPKLERTSHEPPTSTRDVSPPPVAPAAPSFGSVPNRATAAEVGSNIGKPPPTGPRALKEDRPALMGASPVSDSRAPPLGPSRPNFTERSPPSTLRAPGRTPGPSSKQWINPNLKSRVPESPKMARSLSFAQSRPAGFRHDGGYSDQLGDTHQGPPSSDARDNPQVSRSHTSARDSQDHIAAGDSAVETRPLSAGSSVDRGYKPKGSAFVKQASADSDEEPGEIVMTDRSNAGPSERSQERKRRQTITTPAIRISVHEKEKRQPVLDQSSESDEEDIGDIIRSEILGVEKKLKELEAVAIAVPRDAIVRYALVTLESITQIALDPEGMSEMLGAIPQKAATPKETVVQSETTRIGDEPALGNAPFQRNDEPSDDKPTVSPVVSKEHITTANGSPERIQPSIEPNGDAPINQAALPIEQEPNIEDEDVHMEDALETQEDTKVEPMPSIVPSPRPHKELLLPVFDEAQIDSQNASKRESTTPSPPEDEETDDEDIDIQTIEIVREHGQTPPLDSLPVIDEKPWDQDESFMKYMNTSQPGLNTFILQRLKDNAFKQLALDNQLKERYGGNYDNYIRFTMSDDPVAVRSREKFTYVPGASDPVGQKPGLTAEPKPESTRRSRYASERDLERVLEESRRVEDEKRERQLQAEREKYRTDKEAVIPSQYLNEAERFNNFYRDTSGLIEPEKCVTAWEVLPPLDNFTPEETSTFEKAYFEFPKQWGRISDPLANRDFGTCIQFYYLKKEPDDLNLKEKLKKQPKKRKRTRGKARSSALTFELGNGDNDNDENQENGENGERRRPRRAAAPTFNSEATPATDAEGGTPAGTPGRRGAAGRAAADGSEKPKRGRRAAKDKEQKIPQKLGPITLAAAPPQPSTPVVAPKGNRSRSASRVQSSEWIGPPPQDEGPRPPQYEMPPGLGPAGQAMIMPPFSQPQVLLSPERGPPLPDAMAPPPLRPEPPQPPVTVLDMSQPTTSERRAAGQPSSYWSVPEASEFPSLLRSFGSDWSAIASHMRTKTAVMVKNYYTRRKDVNDWEAIVREADEKKIRGEKRPPPPQLTTNTKTKRHDVSGNRPLAAADAVMEDVTTSKLEHHPTSQPMTGRFNVPIAAQPQPPLVPSPFAQTPQAASLNQNPHGPPTGPHTSQPATPVMSPSVRPLRAPLPFADREREPFLHQPSGRTPLVSKPSHSLPPSLSEPPMRHPLPGSMIEPQSERPKIEPKPKEPLRQQERQTMRVKQEPEHPQPDFYGGAPTSIRGPPSRAEIMPLTSRAGEPPRAATQAPQAPYAILQHQPGRGFMGDPTASSSPATPRSLTALSRPMSGNSGVDPYHAPPAQRTPPAAVPAPSRAPKTSNLMALLNDDPPPAPAPAPAPPKRVSEVPVAPKSSSTPPPQSNLSRPPPPPPPTSHVRRESALPEAQPYGYGRNPPPPAPSSMPSLKPYTASPQSQPLHAPRHMALEGVTEREYYGNRARAFPPATAGSPQNTPHYQPPSQTGQVQFQTQPPYAYGAPVQSQPPNASSPPPQYAHHQPTPRAHEPPPPSSREASWPGPSQGHPLQHQQPPPSWAAHPPQPPKSTQPQPTQSPWGAQHGPASKPPQPSTSVPPQAQWGSAPPPRGHDQMALREPYSSRMQQPLQTPYAPVSRAPDPAPPQAQAGYPRYANTPAPGRDPRDQGPPRSYTPVSAYDRSYPPQGQDLRDAHIREQQQQQSALQQSLRPQDRHLYDRQPPPDRYGR